MDSLLDEFSKRVLKDEVYNLLYGDNGKISEDTPFSTLSEARGSILSADNRALWNNQAKANQLEQDYSRALRYYEERNFGSARESALTAIDDAVAVYKGGTKPAVLPPSVSQDLLFQVAGVLVILLALLYAFNNRGKIKGLVSKAPEEVDVYG